MRLNLEYCIQLWSNLYKKDMDLFDRVQRRAMKMIRELEYLSCEERQSWGCSAWRRGDFWAIILHPFNIQWGLTRRTKRDLLPRSVVAGQGAMVLNWWIWIGHKKEIFYNEGNETLEQVSQRSCGCPIIISVQGQVAWGVGQT